MADTRITAPVTNDLLKELISTEELLVATAEVVAKIQAGDADGVQAVADAVKMPDGTTIPGANGARCPVVLTGRGRCTKQAGHLAGPDPTDCTAN